MKSAVIILLLSLVLATLATILKGCWSMILSFFRFLGKHMRWTIVVILMLIAIICGVTSVH